MQMRLIRTDCTDASTIGELFIDGEFQCYTLEDVVRPDGDKIKGKTAIPTGEYEVRITYSNRFKREMPLLLDVPMFEGIRIHPGNTAADTEGCILVGRVKGSDRIGESKAAYAELLERLEQALSGGDTVTISVE